MNLSKIKKNSIKIICVMIGFMLINGGFSIFINLLGGMDDVEFKETAFKEIAIHSYFIAATTSSVSGILIIYGAVREIRKVIWSGFAILLAGLGAATLYLYFETTELHNEYKKELQQYTSD